MYPRFKARQKKKKKKQQQSKLHKGDQTSEEGTRGEEGEWTSAGLSGSPEQSAEKESSSSSSLGISKLRSKLG